MANTWSNTRTELNPPFFFCALSSIYSCTYFSSFAEYTTRTSQGQQIRSSSEKSKATEKYLASVYQGSNKVFLRLILQTSKGTMKQPIEVVFFITQTRNVNFNSRDTAFAVIYSLMHTKIGVVT